MASYATNFEFTKFFFKTIPWLERYSIFVPNREQHKGQNLLLNHFESESLSGIEELKKLSTANKSRKVRDVLRTRTCQVADAWQFGSILKFEELDISKIFDRLFKWRERNSKRQINRIISDEKFMWKHNL